MIKETEYELLLNQDALKIFRSQLKDFHKGYYWWEADDQQHVKEVLERHLLNKRKITFENIEFLGPPNYFLWASFFLMTSRDFSTPNFH